MMFEVLYLCNRATRSQRIPPGRNHTGSPPLPHDTCTGPWLGDTPWTMSQLDCTGIWKSCGGKSWNHGCVIRTTDRTLRAAKCFFNDFNYTLLTPLLPKSEKHLTSHSPQQAAGWRNQLHSSCSPDLSHDWGSGSVLSEGGTGWWDQRCRKDCNCMLEEQTIIKHW